MRTNVGALILVLALLLTGCQSAQPRTPVEDKAATEAADRASEARGIADATLGKQSEILAQGDLAQNGREQLLVVNRFSKGASGAGAGNTQPIFVTRAAIFEKTDGKWSEILRCDEHLKNPHGYLGGVPSARVAGWRLEYGQDATKGIEMRFTPEDGAAGGQESNARETAGSTVVVRWNAGSKRYQSLDRSHARFLAELPALEAEPSYLK
ncbi:MAG TPA: hypothetical protein VGT24_09585 [Candidatus Acidoferrales bacterium]|nr:hypothetical protein [Candidatus Acidoferrales bacterium]